MHREGRSQNIYLTLWAQCSVVTESIFCGVVYKVTRWNRSCFQAESSPILRIFRHFLKNTRSERSRYFVLLLRVQWNDTTDYGQRNWTQSSDMHMLSICVNVVERKDIEVLE